MSGFNVIVALLGGLIVVLGLVSKPLSKSPFPATVVALAIGILVGPEVLGLVDLAELGSETLIREKVARLTLGIGLVGVALRVPREYPRESWRSMLVLVGLGMILMWAISTALVYLILGLPFWMAALIAAIVTPTDPIAASPIVTGSTAEENIPERLRDAISFESGGNDGLSYLFVFLAFLMLERPAGEALSRWLVHTLLWQVGAATALGLVLGFAAGKLLRFAVDAGTIKSEWRLVYTVALALLAVGAGRLIHSDEVLVVFAAGAAFVQVVSSKEREEEDRGQEAVNRFFAVPIFTVLGIAIPWSGWQQLGWSGLALAAAVLVLRRPPVLLLLRPLIPDLRNSSEALFLGWFGPVAVAAIYYASLMEHKLHEPVIWHVVSLVICASVVAHGMTGAPVTRLFGRTAGLRSGRIGAGEGGEPEAERGAVGGSGAEVEGKRVASGGAPGADEERPGAAAPGRIPRTALTAVGPSLEGLSASAERRAGRPRPLHVRSSYSFDFECPPTCDSSEIRTAASAATTDGSTGASSVHHSPPCERRAVATILLETHPSVLHPSVLHPFPLRRLHGDRRPSS